MSGRQNEYFIPGDGISREVIQADICRYLGNDALVRPGNHNGCQGYFIRAYRNLTSEMIADLKADSSRWEADVMRRKDQGHPRGHYYHNDYHMQQEYPLPHQGPNVLPPTYGHGASVPPAPSYGTSVPPASYGTSAPIHEARSSTGPSPPPTYSAPPPQQYMESYATNPYGQAQTPPYSTHSTPTSYPATHSNHSNHSTHSTTHSHSPFAPGQNQFPSQQQIPPFTTSAQPAVSAEIHPSYKYTSSGYGYDGGWNNAPRTYPGPGYETETEYSPITTGVNYPATTAADPRMPGMGLRYTPESTYSDRNRPQPARDNRAR
ncbi:putative transcription factor RfeG [Aspergillus glaucus CBS 516.65]|uniref:Transcription factor RfeG n=1 Tax=Aspergillus glaucus CBS 516.65 TaxID=1160497 RepID=A0A1L9VGT8_ASPGL|nr:hypothetical protein ASPGLDRAFT_450508 [Aspergillus glaucus CBS 516.65]OJJ83052.1 hypothetical protein ASPGLDRAFT_450508 [Aspergillus glaucus CBS 516.65]